MSDVSLQRSHKHQPVRPHVDIRMLPEPAVPTELNIAHMEVFITAKHHSHNK